MANLLKAANKGMSLANLPTTKSGGKNLNSSDVKDAYKEFRDEKLGGANRRAIVDLERQMRRDRKKVAMTNKLLPLWSRIHPAKLTLTQKLVLRAIEISAGIPLL